MEQPDIVPFVETGMAVADGRMLPVVVVDASQRPDVADLARVHEVEGIGDLMTLLRPIPGGVELRVRCTHPVRCEFAVEIPERERPVLDHVATEGLLVIATSPPSASGPTQPTWLALDVDPDALRDALGPG